MRNVSKIVKKALDESTLSREAFENWLYYYTGYPDFYSYISDGYNDWYTAGMTMDEFCDSVKENMPRNIKDAAEDACIDVDSVAQNVYQSNARY